MKETLKHFVFNEGNAFEWNDIPGYYNRTVLNNITFLNYEEQLSGTITFFNSRVINRKWKTKTHRSIYSY
jgi:hypothetical protein